MLTTLTSNYFDDDEQSGSQQSPERNFGNNPYADMTQDGFQPEQDLHIEASQYLMLPRAQPPRQDDCLLHGDKPAADDAISVIVTQEALQQIKAHCESNLKYELGGVLLGRPYHSNRKIFVQIEAAVPAVTDDSGPVHFTFTADAWAQIHVDRSAWPDLEIVGWYHTHPDLGVFYSADDEVVHSAAFTQPWHVGLVVDPVRNQASFFAWFEQQIRPLAGFYELIPATAGRENEMPRAIVDWDVVIEKSWLNSGQRNVMDIQYSQQPIYHPLVPLTISLVALLCSLVAIYIAIR